MSDPRRNMAVAHGTIAETAVSVGNTATLLPTTALANRQTVIIFNNAAIGGQTVYVGDSGVTSVNGMPIPPQNSFSFDVGQEIALYGITAAATADVRLLEAK